MYNWKRKVKSDVISKNKDVEWAEIKMGNKYIWKVYLKAKANISLNSLSFRN